MSELNLFKITKDGQTNVGIAQEMQPSSVLLEKELQVIIEKNMESFFGVKFLASEYVIREGRMDSIGIDENGCPVIFEYKRNQNENVINQGLFYLDWLLDHRGEFENLVWKKMGVDWRDKIDWAAPCVMCIAYEFNKYDVHAVKQMQKNIKLVQYRKYGDGIILFEHINSPVQDQGAGHSEMKTLDQKSGTLGEDLKSVYDSLCEYIESLGDDLTRTQLKLYVAYRKVKNVFCIEIYSKQIIVRTKIDPDTVKLENGFTRDTRNIGHHGTGDFEITIRSKEDFEKAKPLLERAYQEAD